MSVMGTEGVIEFWAKAKEFFGRKLSASTTATTASIQLKNNAGTNLGDAATIASATSTAAGVMSADDKNKLDKIEAGANSYTHPAYTARTGKPTGNQTPGFGSTFTISQITSDEQGHVTNAVDRTVKIPNAAASPSSGGTGGSAGLMSAVDKEKLDSIDSGANKYEHPTTTAHSASFVKVGNDEKGHVVLGNAVVAADIPDLPASKITSGSFAVARIPTVTVEKGGTGSTTAAGARTNLDVYSKSEVESLVAGGSAFQGTVDSNTTISNSSYKSGWYWVVSTAGTYVDQTCEPGDMIFAISNRNTSYAASDFSVIQNNLIEMTAAEVDAICV